MSSIPSSAPSRANPGHRSLSIRILHSFDEAEPFRSAWNDLNHRAPSDIFQTFEWSKIWWKYYGTKRELHLILCFTNDELVGIVPAFIENLHLGFVGIRAAKLIGSDHTINLCQLPILPPALQRVLPRVIQYFLGKGRCDLFNIGPLATSDVDIEMLLAAARNGDKVLAESTVLGTDCNTYFHLPENFTDYLRSLNKQARGNFLRSVIQLTNAHQVTFDFVSEPSQLMAEFESFCALHEAQWRAEGKLGHFGDWPLSGPFTRDVIRCLGAQGLVRFYRIIADGRLISSQLCYVYKGVNYWRLPARLSAPEWDKYSLGRMGLLKMIESSLSAGVRVIEGGRGHYPYKLQLGAYEVPLRSVQYVRDTSSSRARVRVFTLYARLLDRIYYRGYFLRLAPRLPIRRSPLRQLWIRSKW